MRKKKIFYKVFYIVDIIWIISSAILLIGLVSTPCDKGLAVLERAGWFLLAVCMSIIGIVALLIPPIIELIKSSFSGDKDAKRILIFCSIDISLIIISYYLFNNLFESGFMLNTGRVFYLICEGFFILLIILGIALFIIELIKFLVKKWKKRKEFKN